MNSSQLVNIGNYTFNSADILGKGSTGNVYQGINLVDHKEVAIKVINLKQGQNQVTLSLLQSQKNALRLLPQDKNLLKLVQIIQTRQYCYIITQLYGNGSLSSLISSETLAIQNILQMFRSIVSGYIVLSNQNIIHRDLKPSNIMLDINNQPVIIDFGYCQIIRTGVLKAFNVGSPKYMPPEAYNKTLYSQKSDVWALGIILYQMLTNKTIDQGLEVKQYFNTLNQDFINNKLAQFKGISYEILSHILKINPQQRISGHAIKYILDKAAIQKMQNNSSKISYEMRSQQPKLNQNNRASAMLINFSNINNNESKINNNESKTNSLKLSLFGNENINFTSISDRNYSLRPKLTESVQKLVQSRNQTNYLSNNIYNTKFNQRKQNTKFNQYKQENLKQSTLIYNTIHRSVQIKNQPPYKVLNVHPESRIYRFSGNSHLQQINLNEIINLKQNSKKVNQNLNLNNVNQELNLTQKYQPYNKINKNSIDQEYFNFKTQTIRYENLNQNKIYQVQNENKVKKYSFNTNTIELPKPCSSTIYQNPSYNWNNNKQNTQIIKQTFNPQFLKMNLDNVQQNEYKSYNHSNLGYGHESMGPFSPNIQLINTKPNQYQTFNSINMKNHQTVNRNTDSHIVHSNLDCHNHQAYFQPNKFNRFVTNKLI